MKFVFGRIENILGREENACYQHFLFFALCFQKASLSGSFKGELCGNDKNKAQIFGASFNTVIGK